jgi:hypothetical protein
LDRINRSSSGIEFFGYSGSDLNKIKAALPFHEKDEFDGETFADKVGKQLNG